MQMIGIHSIEDCLEILTGLQKHNLKFEIDSSDSTIINSIARQVFKGTALTDRQYNLMKEKLPKYKEQFETQEVIGFDHALEKLRLPLRTIDRSKVITIVGTSDVYSDNTVYESYKENWKWIKIRFPFAKKTIMSLESIARKYQKMYVHKKGSHEHYFVCKENIAYDIVAEFKNKEFVIDSVLLEWVKKIELIYNNKKNHLPVFTKTGFKNIPASLDNIISSELGNFDPKKITLYYDRRFRYGIEEFDTTPAESGLVHEILARTSTVFLSPPKNHTMNMIIDSLNYLERFPMLVILDNHSAADQLLEFYSTVKNIISNEEQSVLFRLEGNNDNGFNQFVKDKQLNNWVDINTKIVYINSNTLPKLLLKDSWMPITCFSYTSSLNRNINYFINDYCDLVVFREESLSPMRRYSSYYG